MKVVVFQLACIAIATVLAALIGWAVSPEPTSALECDVEVIADNEICLATVQAGDKEVFWIDARARKSYDERHVEGAHLLNVDPAEDWNALLAEAMEQGLGSAELAVIYCGKTGCAASKEVEQRLRDGVFAALPAEYRPPVKILYGGERALVAAGLLD